MATDRKDATRTGDEVAREAQHLGDRAVETAQEMAQRQKVAGAERVEHVAEAMRSSAEHLESTEKQLAEMVGSAAGQLEHLAHSLREKDFGALLAEMEDFGRRQPAVFMGAAVALGFGIARFAKAGSGSSGRSGQHEHRPRWDNDEIGDEIGRRDRGTSGLGDYPGSSYQDPDRPGGFRQTDIIAGAAPRPQAGDR
jgi:hypothetical protein